MSSIFDVAQSVVEALRVDLHEWKQSPDLLDKVQRCAAQKENNASQLTSVDPPAPPHWFHPLVTAPVTHVLFSGDGWQQKMTATAMAASADNAGTPAAANGDDATVQTLAASAAPSRLVSSQQKNDSAVSRPTASSPLHHPPTAAPTAAPSSRSKGGVRQLSPAAQRLYADMEKRGQAAAQSDTDVASLWRRRTAVPQDAELRRAVRDYLYRMNILSCMDVSGAEASGVEMRGEGTSPALADAVANGTALCQLVLTLLQADDEGAVRRDAVPCRCPRTLEEVRVNYAAALSALRSVPAAAQDQIPSTAWSILPEDVLVRAKPTALLELFVHLISTYLPSPEDLPTWKQSMCWQAPADRAAVPLVSSAELAAAEAECCAFLHAVGVLPDPALCRLPGPECLIPPAVAAPFIANWKAYMVRSDSPPCLLIPSVWPFLCNGVLLVLLARRSGVADAARLTQPAPVGGFFPNPRTLSCCTANISTAFRCFQAVSMLPSSLQFFTAESASAVLRGDRMHVVSLLLHLRDVLAGKESASMLKSCAVAKNSRLGKEAAEAALTPLRSDSASSHALQTPATVACGNSSLTLKRLTPATITKGVARRCTAASPTNTTTSSRASPSVASSVHIDAAVRYTPSGTPGAPSTSRQRDGDEVQWLCRVVEPHYQYTAPDRSFSFDAHHSAVSDPCWIFSDGVLLAYLIGRLECRRCDFLDCVQPASKRAAKLFNVRRCLEYLRSSCGVAWDLPLLDEALVSGSVKGVLSVLRTLRSHYGSAGKGVARCSDEAPPVPASAM